MKWFSKVLAVALAVGFLLGTSSTRADLEVSGTVRIHSVAEFEAPLTPHGTWVTVASFGRCWRPAHVAVEWRPYSVGYWEWTDLGWYWATDEPWGWACYHYGRWMLDPTYGWVWVPGIEWAPAWVSWRFGGGYCGWAPLAPVGVVIAPTTFVFVEERHFYHRHHPRTVIVNNTTVINKTRIIGGVKHEERQIAGVGRQRVVVNEGPSVGAIQSATGQTIQRTPIREAVQRTPAPSGTTPAPTQSVPAQPPATRPTVPETRAPERRTPPPETRTTPAPETRPPVPEKRPVAPETRTAPPAPRTVPSPPPRTPPPETRTAPGERSPVRGREHIAPAPPRPPAVSPREAERRAAAGRPWRQEREGR